jgi:putative membrane protein
MIFISFYSLFIQYIEINVLEITKENHLNNVTIMHGMTGFVISLLLVFRTNTAYDRWWEGRKLWGSLTNNSRNLAIKLSAILKTENDKAFFKNQIGNFAYVLHDHLNNDDNSKTLFDGLDLNIDHNKHKPNQIVQLVFAKINNLYETKQISGNQLIILNSEIQSFAEICGACERIKNTPIPYSYSSFLKKFIFFYIMSLPFGYSFSLGFYVVPVVVFIFYVLASLELIAEEIEDPFGNDVNDLPTKKMALNIKKSVEEIL